MRRVVSSLFLFPDVDLPRNIVFLPGVETGDFYSKLVEVTTSSQSSNYLRRVYDLPILGSLSILIYCLHRRELPDALPRVGLQLKENPSRFAPFITILDVAAKNNADCFVLYIPFFGCYTEEEIVTKCSVVYLLGQVTIPMT
ncbi:MAG TPA: hypothetical protein G4O07_01925 [Dehalococcoidia bacterium]|nr:hypothetical protein [Dehalococcoidia bacterium]